MRNQLFFTLLLLLIAKISAAQCNPKEYKRIFAEAVALQEKGKFIEAKNTYEAAKIYACGQKQKDATDGAVDKLFDQINQLRIEARKERENADREKEKAELAKALSDSLLIITQIEKKRTQDVLDMIYFYAGSFGLAFDASTREYGFIDKNLNTKIEFQYTEALNFEEIGFARVKKKGEYYLIDTFENTYLLSTTIYNNDDDKDIMALDLRQEDLFEIPKEVFKLKQLQILLFSSNSLDSIGSEIEQLEGLQFLDFSENERAKLLRLGTMPGAIPAGKSLAIPQINKYNKNRAFPHYRFNRLTSLPSQIGKLKNLKSLGLSYNDLATLPPEIGHLQNLQSLNIAGNELTTLPEEIGQLINLKFFDVSNNKLANLPISIGQLKSLKKLNIKGNPLSMDNVDLLRRNMPWCDIQF